MSSSRSVSRSVTQVNERTSEVHTERYAKAKLRMSRSFGDFYLKQETHLTWDAQAVTACPETHVLQRSHRYDVDAMDAAHSIDERCGR